MEQIGLFKGELMEEYLRNYFNTLGYYVVRSIKFRYEEFDITDVDLFLYERSSSLSRQRINVDIKNKKSPQTFERILWANGVKELLTFDATIVATTDTRPVIQKFGLKHKTIILDGTFLSKLKTNTSIEDRFSEEELQIRFSKCKSHKSYPNKDWRFLYELSKSKLLTELDYSGFNSSAKKIGYFIEKIVVDDQKREDATRLLYLILSHALIIIDYIVKDIAFFDVPIKEKKLSEGFNFGNLGKDGVDKVFSIATKIAGKSLNSSNALGDSQTDIFKDYFSKNENAKNLYSLARNFEDSGFKRSFVSPNSLLPAMQGVIALFLDYHKIERRKFFDSFS
jgi:hypothetical protein